MSKKSEEDSSKTKRKFAPAITPEARENQMISLAMNLAEKHLVEGTASAAEITHFLKLATQRERIEKEILAEQRNLLVAKTDSIKSYKRNEELYKKAINAMKICSGEEDDEFEEDIN